MSLFSRRKGTRLALLSLICGLASLPAHAQTRGDAPSPDTGAGFEAYFRQGPAETILHCGALDKRVTRLACLDAAYRHFTDQVGNQTDDPAAVADGGDRSPPSQPPSSDVATAKRSPSSSDAADSAAAETARAASDGTEVAGRGRLITREATLEDIGLPLETRVTAFNMNRRGDFLLKIEEGWVFRRASGPPAPGDLTGQTVVLEKNFLGNWRLQIPSRVKPLWVKPVEGEPGSR